MTFDYERVISTSYIHCIYSKNVNNTYFAIMKRYDCCDSWKSDNYKKSNKGKKQRTEI